MKNIKARRLILIILLPMVSLGLYFVYQKTKKNEIYAVDPMVVTYNGETPPSPLFTLDDMKPGDTYERCFNVKNTYTEEFAVEMSTYMSLEEKNFTDVLEIIVYDPDTNEIIFSGLLKDFFADSPFALGNLEAEDDRDFCIKVYFPHESGNEYQEAKAVFDIIWRTELPEDEIPPECEHLRGKIKSVIYGTEGNDKIKGNIYSNLIFALGGDDWIDSSSGDDCVVLGEGNDTVYSESGNDVIIGVGGKNKIYSGSGNDIVYGGTGDDYIEAGSGNDTVWGGAGNDKILLGSGFDKGYGGEGDDKIFGGSDDDYIDGGPGNDKLYGDSGTDTCLNGPGFTSCEL